MLTLPIALLLTLTASSRIICKLLLYFPPPYFVSGLGEGIRTKKMI